VVCIVDADETVMGPVPDLPDEADVGWVTIHSSLYPKPYLEPRIIRVREGFHYDRRHHWVYDGQDRLVASHRRKGAAYVHVDLDCHIVNMRDWRTDAREAAKKSYRTQRNPAEAAHRTEGP
jgi:hypothetical protein